MENKYLLMSEVLFALMAVVFFALSYFFKENLLFKIGMQGSLAVALLLTGLELYFVRFLKNISYALFFVSFVNFAVMITSIYTMVRG